MTLGVRPRRVIFAFKSQDGLCLYCMNPVDESNATWEHVVPRSWGGHEAGRNEVLACEPCNSLKSEIESMVTHNFSKHTPLPTRAALFILHAAVRFRTHKKKTTAWKMRYARMAHHMLEMADCHVDHHADVIPEIDKKLRVKFF